MTRRSALHDLDTRFLDALASIEGAQSTRQDDGTIEIAFSRPGSGTIVGHAVLTASELSVETNSARRATVLRTRVERACRGLPSGHRRQRRDASITMYDYSASR